MSHSLKTSIYLFLKKDKKVSADSCFNADRVCHYFWNISTMYRQSSALSLHVTGSKPLSQHPHQTLGQSFILSS